MSASAAVLSLLQAAQTKGQLSAASLANAGDWLRSGALPAAISSDGPRDRASPYSN